MTALLLTLGGFGLLGLLCHACYHAGQSDRQAKDLHDSLATTDEAAAIRDRLRHDAAYAEQLRDRFTR